VGEHGKHHGVDGAGQAHHRNGGDLLHLLPAGPSHKHSDAAAEGFPKVTAGDEADDVLLPIGGDVPRAAQHIAGGGDGAWGAGGGDGVCADEPEHGDAYGGVRVVGGEEAEGQMMMRWRVGIDLMKEVCWGGVGPLLQLAVPSCLGMCLEWWWYEIVTVMAGYLPNPTLAVAATGILIQTTSMMYTVPMALAGCVSARVTLFSFTFHL
jgi:hypothetical protein